MGRTTKKFSIIALAWMIALLVMGLLPQWAWADPAAPTNLQVESARVCHNLLEDDDFLVVFHYNIDYTEEDQPDDPANRVFTFRLLDTNGIDQLGAIVPYAYFNAGYDQGIAHFYFPADTAPDWELPYIIRISGNPEYFGSPPLTSRTLTISDYSQMESQEENQVVLGNYIIDVAEALQVNWSTTLLYSGELGTVLYSTGETYFQGAIPGLQAMAPQIFAIQSSAPEYGTEEWTEAQGEAYGSRFEDTWVGKAVEALGDAFSIKWNVMTGLIILAMIIAIAIWCQVRYGNVKPLSVSSDILIIGGTVMGWIAPAIMAITTIFLGLFAGYVLIFRHG